MERSTGIHLVSPLGMGAESVEMPQWKVCCYRAGNMTQVFDLD